MASVVHASTSLLPSAFMDYFERLGVALEDAWSERNREEERFPAAALEVLARMPPQQAWGRAALLDHLLDPHRPVPLQLAPLGAFGQPGFTVLHGHGFVVEVYHWLESLSAIHDHPFCGAFTILDEAGMFGAGEEASVVIGHVLVEGGGPERALAELRAAYGAEAIAAHEADVRSFCETSLLAVLREDPRSTSAAS